MNPKKPCANCGVVPDIQLTIFGFYIECENIECMVSSRLEKTYRNKSDAIAVWDAPRWYEPPMIDEVPNLDSQRRETA